MDNDMWKERKDDASSLKCC